MGYWELHTINLSVTRKARLVFEGVRGESPSHGGFSLDDINLSSTKCPQHIWHIRNMSHLLATMPPGQKLYSPRFLSPAGYSFQVMRNYNAPLKPKRKSILELYSWCNLCNLKIQWNIFLLCSKVQVRHLNGVKFIDPKAGVLGWWYSVDILLMLKKKNTI